MAHNQPQPGIYPQFQPHASPMVHGAGVYQQPGPPVIIRAPVFGPESSSAYCHTCKQNVDSKPIMKASGKTHLIAIALCVIGCCLCAPCVYCVKTFNVIQHYCPQCNSYLGVYSSI